jgi:hypothetical protein
MENWKLEVVKAYTSTRLLRIDGYQSSDGGTSDFIVRLPLEQDIYWKLVKESFELLRDGKIACPSHFASVWPEAVNEQLESWQRTLNGETRRNSTPEYSVHPDGYMTKAGNANTVVLPHVVILQRRLRQLHSGIKSALKTMAKAHIRNHTPINAYRGALLLEPGKFELVQCVKESVWPSTKSEKVSVS